MAFPIAVRWLPVLPLTAVYSALPFYLLLNYLHACYTVVTLDDTGTLAGDARHEGSRQLQTMLRLRRSKSDCKLCGTVNTLSGRRRRRQAEWNNNERVVTKDIVDDVLDYQEWVHAGVLYSSIAVGGLMSSHTTWRQTGFVYGLCFPTPQIVTFFRTGLSLTYNF